MFKISIAVWFLLLVLPCIGTPKVVNDTLINTAFNNIDSINKHTVNQLQQQYLSFADRINKKTWKILLNYEKLEAKLKKRIAQKDSVKAKQLYKDTESKINSLKAKCQQPDYKLNPLREYIPTIDSVQTASKFLLNTTISNNSLNTENIKAIQQLQASNTLLSQKLQISAEVQQFIQQRKTQLKQQLAGYDVDKYVQQMHKEVYYYQQQIAEYKNELKDLSKLQVRFIATVRKLPAFQQFMAKHSHLAELFKVPQNYGTPQGLQGLQTVASVQQLLQGKSGLTGSQEHNYFKEQMQVAKQKMSQLKEQVNNAGGNSSNTEMPNFKPNSQKTKSFFKRLELGCNIQSQRPNGLLPVSSDFALTIGYKLNDYATIGLGGAYKLGWGNSINKIAFTNQGVAIRSFVDIKMKKGIWLTGGYEKNYLPKLGDKLPAFRLPVTNWQTSGLIGITKKYKVGKRENNMQLLWDFLSYQQLPKTAPIKFRVGFKL